MVKILPEPARESLNLTQILDALADPIRRHLLRRAYEEHQPLACSKASADLDLSSATLSHHWKVLREAGLTRTTVSGRFRSIQVRNEDIDWKFPGLLDVILRTEDSNFLPKKSSTDIRDQT